MTRLKLFFSSILFASLLLGCSAQQSSPVSIQKVPAIEDYIEGKNLDNLAVATFAGGCFWCTEASFEQIKGVKEVISGYSGGVIKHPSYRQVASGSTKHAEAIQIYYNPEEITFATLLEVFYVAHDGTQVNRQGPDVGPQYRSEIFFHSEEQKTASLNYIKKLNDSGKFSDPIATIVNPYTEFWVAEAYHQDYYPDNQNNPYIANVSKPKVEKVQKVFKTILKDAYK